MSRIMPKAEDEKIALGLNKFFVFLCLLVIGLFVFVLITQNRYKNCIDSQFDSCDIRYELANSDTSRMKGLSGRDKIATNEGMLFVFENSGQQCFWMRDMKFNLDIIWLDKDKKILSLDENISPNTYPQNFCEDDVRYVLEVNAGVARQQNMSIGSTLVF